MRGVMSAAKAEEYLGLPRSADGKALLRRALEKEKTTGKRFLIREGGNGKGRRYKFTAEMIRKHLPELWEGRFERISRVTQQTISRIEAHIDQHIDERIEVNPTVQQAIRQSDKALQQLLRLSANVEKLLKG